MKDIVIVGSHAPTDLHGIGHPVAPFGLRHSANAVVQQAETGADADNPILLRHPYFHSLQIRVGNGDNGGIGCLRENGETFHLLPVNYDVCHSRRMCPVSILTIVFARAFQRINEVQHLLGHVVIVFLGVESGVTNPADEADDAVAGLAVKDDALTSVHRGVDDIAVSTVSRILVFCHHSVKTLECDPAARLRHIEQHPVICNEVGKSVRIHIREIGGRCGSCCRPAAVICDSCGSLQSPGGSAAALLQKIGYSANVDGVAVCKCGVVNGNLRTIDKSLPDFEQLVRQTVPVKIYEGQCTLALGTAIVEVAAHTKGCQSHIRPYADGSRTTHIPALASGGPQCSGVAFAQLIEGIGAEP